MRVILVQLLFQFALTSAIKDLLPIINITVTRDEKDIFHAAISQNCCVINFSDIFKVMVYIVNTNQVKKEIDCYDSHNFYNKMVKKKLVNDSGGYSARQKAKAYMATEWTCRLNSSLSSSFYTPPFKVHVRGQKTTILYINKDPIAKFRANYTTTDYDEYVYHSYIDGEMTKFEYTINNMVPSSIQKFLYRYYVTEEQFMVDKGVLYLRLTKEFNNNYLDCKVTEINGTISTTLRIFFRMKTVLEFPRFKINELVLNPIRQSDNAEYDSNNPNGTFVYDYINNENVIIRTLTGNGSSLKCNNEKNSLQTVKDIHLKTTLKKDNNNLKLSCTVKDSQHQNSVKITLKFKYVEAFDFGPLSGLSWANVLTKYKNVSGDAVIKYSYRGEKLVLVCYAKDKGMRWKFNLTQTGCLKLRNGCETHSGKFFETWWFEMKPNYNRTTIQCFEDHKPGAQVELIRDGSLKFENNSETDIMKYFDSAIENNDLTPLAPKTDTQSGNKAEDGISVSSPPKDSIPIKTELKDQYIEDNTDEESFLKEYSRALLIGGTVTIATIVIVIILCVIIKRFKHKKIEQVHSSNINYENLPEHNDGPMPIPQQWQCQDDEVTYSTPDVGKSIDNLYAKPIPKSLRNPIYAEAYDHTNKSGADYVNTGRFVKRTANEGKDDGNYSEVYQSIREANSNSKIKYANIEQINETYAQVEDKTTRDSIHVGNLKEHSYGNLDVTDDQSFNHYSEPAYAEIQ